MAWFWPWALAAGLVALPLAVAIYWFRQHRPPRPVGSLLLWRREQPAHRQGRRVERLRAPWLLALELLILLLLALAAGGPRLEWTTTRRPLVVVLDDSFSMRAGGNGSPRQQAADALLEVVEDGRRHGPVTLVLAGEESRVLAQDLEPEEVAPRLEGWRCGAPAADLDRALARARGLGGDLARRLVLSDRPPEVEPREGDLEWWSFGEPRSNLAVTAAVRSGADSKAQILVEVSNFGSGRRARELTVEVPAAENRSTVLAVETFDVAAGGVERRRLAVPAEADLRLLLGGEGASGDALGIDDRVWLPAPRDPPVRVALDLESATTRGLIERVLEATGRVRWVDDDAELWITDRSVDDPGGFADDPGGSVDDPGGSVADSDVATAVSDGTARQTWRVELVDRAPTSAYLGPFVLDHRHPLTEGLDLAGAVWAAGQLPEVVDDATVVIRVGDRPLLVDRGGPEEAHHLTLAWNRELSTLDRTTDWPVLWWNLVRWRAAERPGVRPSATRLGAPVRWVREAPGGVVAWRRPELPEQRFEDPPRVVELAAESVGLHHLSDGSGGWTFAVNALAPAESDLRQTASGRWGAWLELEESWGRQRRPGSWIPLILALGLLGLHLALTSPHRGESTRQGRTDGVARAADGVGRESGS